MLQISTPFLTDLDPNIRIKGSRDPLGAQAIWTQFGRKVVGNLTGVTTSLRDFTTLVLGYHFAQRVAEHLGPGSEIDTFLKWEQMAAYSRACHNGDYLFRGTTRVQLTLNSSTKVPLGLDAASQIMSRQKVYGLYGLYRWPAIYSNLVDHDLPALTPEAAEFVLTRYMPVFKQAGFANGDEVFQILRREKATLELKKRDEKITRCVASLLTERVTEAERTFYRFHLLQGGPKDLTEGRQPLLAAILGEPELVNLAWGPSSLLAVAKIARKRGDVGESLAFRLERIRTCESALAPASAAFSYLQGCNGLTIDKAASRLEKQWGAKVTTIQVDNLRKLKDDFAAVQQGCDDRFIGFAEAAAGGDYKQALRHLIAQNQSVMKDRGGTAWIEESGGALKVRVMDEQGALPGKDKLSELWRFTYYLDALLALMRQLRAK